MRELSPLRGVVSGCAVRQLTYRECATSQPPIFSILIPAGLTTSHPAGQAQVDTGHTYHY